MRLLKTIRLRIRSVLQSRQVERDLDEELRDHLERQIDLHRAAGLAPADAQRAALREFGNIPLIREQVRDARRVTWFEDLRRDLEYAIRSMRRAPGLAAVATLSLAVAIGANTTIFSLVNTLMLRDLPVANPGELVELGVGSDGAGNFSYPLFERVRDQHASFSHLLAVSAPVMPAVEEGTDRPPTGRYVSGNFFEALGIQPILGRLLTLDDDRLDTMGSTVAVIGYGLWQRKFGGDPGAIGQTLTLGGFPFPAGTPVVHFTIVGVLPQAFDGLIVGRVDDFYVPFATQPRVSPMRMLTNPMAGWLRVVGRLKPGTSRDAAKADVDVIYTRYLEDAAPPGSEAEMRRRRAQGVTVASARAGMSAPRREFAMPVLLLMGAVALVLLVACANVVNLLLARGLARRGEIGLRLAIGASRGRLVRQLLTESALLGLAGGSLGFAIAVWGTPLIATLMANEDPAIAYDVAPDGTVLLFTASVSLGAALLAGLVPALRVSRATVPSLRDEAGARGGSGATLWSRGLIVSQVALSLLLLAGALLLVTTLRNLRTGDFGFEREGVLTMRLEPGRAGFTGERRLAYFREVLDRARNTPGVRHAALSLGMPVVGTGVNSSFTLEGQPRDPEVLAYVNDVTDGYFAATGTRLLLGRDFGPQDSAASAGVAIINDAVARRHFGDRNPVGQRVDIGVRGVVEIVGVVETTKFESLREVSSPIVYVHAFQSSLAGYLYLTVKTDADPAAMAPAVRRAIEAVAPAAAGPTAMLAAQIDRTLVTERLIARVLGAFAAVALMLAAVGLYGVLAYTVTRRTGEIGVRLALGATRGAVLRAVLRESALLVITGVAIGVPAALVLTRLLSSLLYGITATDPWVLGGAVSSLFLVGLMAASIPAWKASRVDPLVALRCE